MAMKIMCLPAMEKESPKQKDSQPKGQGDKDFLNLLSVLMSPAPIPAVNTPETAWQETGAVQNSIPVVKEQLQVIGIGMPQSVNEMPQMPDGDEKAELTPALAGLETVEELTVNPKQQEPKAGPEATKQEAVSTRQESLQQISQDFKEVTSAPVGTTMDPSEKMKDEKNMAAKGAHQEEWQAIPAAEKGSMAASTGLKVENPLDQHELKKDIKAPLTTGSAAEKTDNPERVQIPLPPQRQEEQKKDHGSLELKSPASHGLAKGQGNQETVSVLSESNVRIPAEKLAAELPGIIDSKLMSGVQGNNRTLVIHLEPKELGKLMVKLSDQDGVVTVRIVTDNAETKTLVQNSLTDLRLSFSENGIKYGRLEVELDGQSLEQQQHPQQNQQQQNQHQQQQNQQHFNWTLDAAHIPKPWQEYAYSEKEASPILVRTHVNQGQVDYTV